MKHGLLIATFLIGLISPSLAEENAYFISVRNAGNAGNSLIEFYNSNLIDFRHFLDTHFDLGLSIDQSESHPIEVSSKVNRLDPSQQIVSSGTTRVLSLYTAYHPWGRKVRWNFDPYLGASLKDYSTSSTRVSKSNYSRLSVSTPEVLGVALKAGSHWFFYKGWGITAELETGQVFANYKVSDSYSKKADTYGAYTMTSASLGVSYQF